MFSSIPLVLLAVVGDATAQSGVDLDKPMLGNGTRTGSGSMLRFGCSQVRTVYRTLETTFPF